MDRWIVVLICIFSFSVFLFTEDGHRFTFDEDVAEQQTIRMVTGQPTPGYIPGVSKINFEYPLIYPDSTGPACRNAIICSVAYVGHSATEVPFVFVNHYLHIMTNNTLVLTNDDFDDPNYVYWRNSLDPDLNFLQFFYGPMFSALSVGVFFLVSRSFDFNQKNSTILAILFAFTTIVWAYSKTSLNVVPGTFFDLLGFLFFRRYQKLGGPNLVYSGSSFGFSFLVRPDAILFIIPLLLFLLIDLRQKTSKLKKLTSFIVPLIGFYGIYILTNFIRDGTTLLSSFAGSEQGLGATWQHTHNTPLPIAIYGLLLSPGVGLFVFCPIMVTAFFSFFAFYKKNRKESLLFLAFVIIFLVYYGNLNAWHGLVAWGPRYLLEVIPFLLLPLGATLEIGKKTALKIALLGLAALGFFFNFVYMIQDAIYFVWCLPSCNHGLFSLGTVHNDLWINPAILWTFKFSPLTQAILVAFTHLQPDIFLLKLLGMKAFVASFAVIIAPQIYLFYKIFSNRDYQVIA